MKKTLFAFCLALAFTCIFTSCENLFPFLDEKEPSIADLQEHLVKIDESDLTQDIKNIELSDGEWECSLEGINSYHPYRVIYVRFKVQGPNITFIDGIDTWRDVNLTDTDLVFQRMNQGYTVTKKRKVYTGTRKDIAILINFVKNQVIGPKNDWDSTKTNADKSKYKCTDVRDSTRETLIVKKLADSTELAKDYNPDDFLNPVPEDAIAIFNPHDIQDYSLPSNFSSRDEGYVTSIVDDETYGKVLYFNRLGDFPYTHAEFHMGNTDLKGKTLYMVLKGKSNIDNSNYTDLKVMIGNGSNCSETYSFIPKDDSKYKIYSAANNQFWAAYQRTGVSDWSNVSYLEFEFQMADYDLKIAAIYYK